MGNSLSSESMHNGLLVGNSLPVNRLLHHDEHALLVRSFPANYPSGLISRPFYRNLTLINQKQWLYDSSHIHIIILYSQRERKRERERRGKEWEIKSGWCYGHAPHLNCMYNFCCKYQLGCWTQDRAYEACSIKLTHTSEGPVATNAQIQYSQKYWQELNLVVEPQLAIVKILVDLNLVVQ